MMSYISNSADFYKMKRDAEKHNEEYTKFMNLFFGADIEARKKQQQEDKEKTNLILDCRFSNFSK